MQDRQSKIKWVTFYGSEPQLHIGFIVSRKWGLNLCLFRWLKFSLKRVSNFMLSLSWIVKTEFSDVLMKLSNAFLNDIGEGNDFMSSPKFFHSWEQHGKNVLLKFIVSFTILLSVDLVCLIDLLWSSSYNVKYLGKSPFTVL